ncbi:MAG: fructose-bisphosphate aldolase class I [Candidatus Rokubacteria bacterium]|nr:fructose-bisphosphate aldolase class I [Candidatus Rokubacteria bacterium]
MAITDLEATAGALVPPGKGILAADESHATVGRRFEAVGIPNTEENRRLYRQMLFAAQGIAEFLSGVILYDETIRQKADDGTPFVDLLARQGILPGIKVDRGTKPLARVGEQVTEGLDGLRERLAEYRALGARFAKWRAVFAIGPGIPSRYALGVNAHALARYAALCQEAGVVPIVEPEVLMEGDHPLERCFEVTEAVLHGTFHALHEQGVVLEGMLLKPNMVLAGERCPRQPSVQEVAEATLRCLRRTVPAAVPGIVFLSGGQRDELATAHLNAMNALPGPHPWQLSFSYARALQTPALRAWRGDPARVAEGQKAFSHRARLNSAARFGRYTPELERAVA